MNAGPLLETEYFLHSLNTPLMCFKGSRNRIYHLGKIYFLSPESNLNTEKRQSVFETLLSLQQTPRDLLQVVGSSLSGQRRE